MKPLFGNQQKKIDASQLFFHSMCQDMPTGFYTIWDYDEETEQLKARQNRV